MQIDNNLVMYDVQGCVVWATRTMDLGKRGTAYLILQIDGNMAIYDGNRQILWTTYSTNNTSNTKQFNTHNLIK